MPFRYLIFDASWSAMSAAMLAMDWDLEVSICNSCLLHHDHHVSPPVPVHIVMRAWSWLTTSRSTITHSMILVIFNFLAAQPFSVKFSLVVFIIIHVIQIPPSHYLLIVHLIWITKVVGWAWELVEGSCGARVLHLVAYGFCKVLSNCAVL